MKRSGRSTFLTAGIILAALILLVTPAPAAKAATSTAIGYLSIPGVTEGCSGVKGYEDSCLVLGFEQGIASHAPTSGGGGGAGRALLSLTVTKPVDRASVKILEDAVMGVQFRDATIRLAPYSIQLKVVTITGVRQHYDPLDAGQAGVGQLEDVTFGFERISWGWDPDLLYCFSVIENRPCSTGGSLF